MEQSKDILEAFVIKSIVIKSKILELDLIGKDNKKVTGIIKNNIDLFLRTYSENDEVLCKGKISILKNKNILDIIYITKQIPGKEVLNFKFEENSETDINDYIQRFNEIIENVNDSDYKLILNKCFNEEIRNLFFIYPATKSNHHNYKYGLLQHSIEVVDISLFLAGYFDGCNKDLLSCAALLHDIGKLKIYDIEENNLTEDLIWEDLLKHSTISSFFVSKMIPQEINSKKILALQHLILSHHNNDIVSCKTKEAFILNKANELSSTMNFLDIIKYKQGKSKINDNTWYNLGEIKDVD